MAKRRRFVLVVLLVAMLGGLVWYNRLPSEPVYEGKPFRVWLEDYTKGKLNLDDGSDPSPQQRQQAAAIVHIGTNAIPVLLHMLQTKHSAVRSNLVFLLKKQTFIPGQLHTAWEYQWLAIHGFEVLGPIAQPAVPGLTHLLGDPEIGWAAALSLGAIGPASHDAVPTLIPWLTNNNFSIRYCAARALGGIGPGANNARSALLQQLNETNRFVRNEIEFALGRQKAYPEILVPMLIKEIQENFEGHSYEPRKVEALGAFGVEAKPGVPILLQLLSKQYQQGHDVEDALKHIDPEAASQAGVK